ncbi:alpha/beta hydrolase [Amycolatopsis sp. NPDC059027]|uniref:alpha/beta hydrolase n=1 Tax=Amycolatopsis sp. NPDC059027 TaxID=3346709 RepID=UPI00366EA06D
MRDVPGDGKRLSYYQFGSTALFASQYDQRFSYCLHVPRGYSEDDDRRYPLVVAVHGTARTVQTCRDEFAGFCEEHDCIVLAPLFPCGIGEPGELSNYKYISYRGIRYDHVLLAMIEEIAGIWRVEDDRFLLTGFSGGGQFVHRFTYLHPGRLRAVSIGAPGVVTLLDADHPWWVGVGDLEERFGTPLDLAALRRVAVHMVVGGADTDTWEITVTPDSPRYQPGADLQGANRIDRITALARSFERHGVAVRLEVVPGAIHEREPLIPSTLAFFHSVLSGQ